MSELTRQQLRQLVAARKRPLCQPLGTLSKQQIRLLVKAYYQFSHRHQLTHTIHQRQARNLVTDGQDYLLQHYHQVHLYQHGVLLEPDCQALISSLFDTFGPCKRVRVSALAGKAHLPNHIDDPQQHRAIALLQGHHSFTIQQPTLATPIPMQIGELWYINTAWPHSVVNPNPEPRLALLLDLSHAPNLETSHADISTPK